MEIPTIREEILEYLATPITWAITEILAIVLFFYCIVDIMKRNNDTIRIFRVIELLGFVFYSGVYENVGVLMNIYNYSLDRVLLFGAVPLEILLLEAVIFYAAILFAEKRNFPNWAIPFVVGLLCVLQDLTIDPVAVFDLHNVNGAVEGQWNWTPHYLGALFGIPFFNFTGWFLMMFYYSGLVIWGRKIFAKSGFKPKNGYLYSILSPIFAILLIISPITNFLLFAQPFAPIFTRTAEIAMLSCITSLALIPVIKYAKGGQKIDFNENKPIWIIPLILHLLDVIYAFALQIQISYIPVLIFGVIHLVYLGLYISFKRKGEQSLIINQNTIVINNTPQTEVVNNEH